MIEAIRQARFPELAKKPLRSAFKAGAVVPWSPKSVQKPAVEPEQSEPDVVVKFDKKAYQRAYMKKRRARQKAAKL